MKILFLHPNFPAQFRHLATTLAQTPENQVVYITARSEGQIPGVQKSLYQVTREVSQQTHRYVRSLEGAVSTGQAAWRVAHQLKTQQGFHPDIVYAHVGWGPGLFMPDIFPKARYIGFFEWYYHAHGTDADFDPADPLTEDDEARIRIKNAPILLELAHCDAGMVPTHWQKQQFPSEFHPKLHVLHDGIDLEFCQPNPGAKLILPATPIERPTPAAEPSPQAKHPKGKGFGKTSPKTSKQASPKLTPTEQIQQAFWAKGLDLSNCDEVVTYISRGMEPYRGFPQFMAAVALLQQQRSHTHVVVVGEDRVAYGKTLPDGQTYREKALDELTFDLDRLHFTGPLTYSQLQQVYQASSVHVYLTRPFVLSWSMLEAMACGCVVLGSKTPPVEEVITDGVNGFLVDFWDVAAIAHKINNLLDTQAELVDIRQQARATIAERYDLAQLLPQHIAFLQTGLNDSMALN